MTKLMKYEFRKQMFSKAIIAILLGLLTVFFFIGIVRDDIDGAALAVGLMAMVMVFSIFYLALESIITYEKELKTKQSYMLFLVPQSSMKILGSKLITSILQILLAMLSYTVVAALCGTALLLRYTSAADREQFMQLVRDLFQIEIDIFSSINVFIAVFLMWTLFVILGYFVITLTNTILPKSKWISFLVVIAYFCLLDFIGSGSDVISDFIIRAVQNAGNLQSPQIYGMESVISILYFGVVDFALFKASAWLIDKKLSV